MTTTSQYPMAERARAAAARFARRLRAIHAAQGCTTWERLTDPQPNVVDGRPVEGWGCQEHHIFTTAQEG